MQLLLLNERLTFLFGRLLFRQKKAKKMIKMLFLRKRGKEHRFPFIGLKIELILGCFTILAS